MSTTYQTRYVLAAAYKGKDIGERALLTHTAVVDDGREVRTLCRQPVENLVDEYGMTSEELVSEPTCKTCAKRWKKFMQLSNESA
jgi:hypothetical protein